MKNFLNSEQVFIRGQYRGESLEAVVMDDPDHIVDLLENYDINDEEAETMMETLKKFKV